MFTIWVIANSMFFLLLLFFFERNMCWRLCRQSFLFTPHIMMIYRFLMEFIFFFFFFAIFFVFLNKKHKNILLCIWINWIGWVIVSFSHTSYIGFWTKIILWCHICLKNKCVHKTLDSGLKWIGVEKNADANEQKTTTTTTQSTK